MTCHPGRHKHVQKSKHVSRQKKVIYAAACLHLFAAERVSGAAPCMHGLSLAPCATNSRYLSVPASPLERAPVVADRGGPSIRWMMRGRACVEGSREQLVSWRGGKIRKLEGLRRAEEGGMEPVV